MRILGTDPEVWILGADLGSIPRMGHVQSTSEGMGLLRLDGVNSVSYFSSLSVIV